VVEQWDGTIDFVSFARHGEMVSNLREDHETSMFQKVLAQPHW
jgi:hypothetical protein